ncbi:porin [Bradyrhizobium japonicum]|uniref:carbohydrate porin n=1 Tax=Bradyrhizobium TaxID=374 RepID=UPI001E5A9E6D|nr:carbohydrate porin [Bradyrhizobium japonicum]MCD9824429.1 carbohydrate porin [Bradyrhizobium japonicum]MCD9897735.1 carbohydrate porin [Bradyrhizobium japonicum]MEB2677257.1 carbohydrate porin [Bradyrhizobium japonicum]WLB31405.1 carbohydrate porin [Bradyrhizobium japonicum]WRI87554.1 carbohydrate porin [Bradyrhizobium japonicum]
MARWADVPPIRIETVSRTKRRFGQLLLAAALLAAGAAAAQADKKTDDDKPADPDTGESTVEEKTLGLLPNPFQKYGVKFAATYIGEVLGNPSGELKQGSVYEGRLNLAVDLDLQKLAGLDQLTFHANMFQIHGGGLSRGSLQNYLVVSGIEALPSTRLYEAYFEKQWGDKKVSLKVGQLAADSEFFNTKYTDVLTNASMGWPAITSLDLPSGGPSPPLAAMGARLLVNVTEQLSVLGGIFDGDQAGPGPGDPQERNRYGVNFRVNDPPLLLGQIQYAWNNTKGDPNPAGQIKFGGWRHFGSFADQRFASNGVSLASPTSSGEPLLLSGDIGGWMVFEQKLYRVPKSDDRGIGIFARVSGAPADRNLIDRYADAGIEFIGLDDRRPDDKFGIAAGYAHVSKRAQALDADYRTFVDPTWPMRSFEGLLTAVYQYQIRDGWTLQPNLQYIIHPGGGATSPSSAMPGKALHNATVLGLRTTLKF